MSKGIKLLVIVSSFKQSIASLLNWKLQGCPPPWRPVPPSQKCWIPPHRDFGHSSQSDIFGALRAHLALIFLCFHFESDVDYWHTQLNSTQSLVNLIFLCKPQTTPKPSVTFSQLLHNQTWTNSVYNHISTQLEDSCQKNRSPLPQN